MRGLLRGLVIAALAVVVAGAAQLPAGSVSGVATDTSRGRLPGVAITVMAEGLRRTATTDRDGKYRIEGLPPGRYNVEARFPGFVTETVESVSVEAGRDVAWSPSMRTVPPRYGEAPDAPDSVENYVARLTGPDAVECGRHSALADEATLKKSLDCALTASRERKAFRTIMQFGGIDSWIARGLAGQSDGVVFRFDYDSQPCGGPGCEARFTLERCPVPTIAAERNRSGQGVTFACRSAGDAKFD